MGFTTNEATKPEKAPAIQRCKILGWKTSTGNNELIAKEFAEKAIDFIIACPAITPRTP